MSMSSKFLCICTYGHSRSVAMARVLHHNSLQAVAMGTATAGQQAFDLMTDWADVILLAEAWHIGSVPRKNHPKVVDLKIGEDKWSNPYNADLLTLCHRHIRIYLAMDSLLSPV